MHCYHCGTIIIDEVKAKIDGKVQSFCCYGCSGAAQFIIDNDLTDFYKNKKGIINLKFNNQYPLEYYDLDSFKEEFVMENKLILFSPSIHCAACVFLIEKTLSNLEEVDYIRVNLTSLRISLTLSGRGKLSNIFKTLASLGYSSETLNESNQEQQLNSRNQALLRRIGFAFFAMMNMLWVSIAIYSGAKQGEYYDYFLWLSFIIATPTLLYSGAGFIKSSYYSLKNHSLNMDVPIVIGAFTTYIYSTLVLFDLISDEIYFDTVVNFIFVILIGRYFEAASKKQVLTDTNSIASLDIKFATVINSGKEYLSPVKSIKEGSIISIKPGSKIALDGEIISGNLSVDESLISGESLPIDKVIGDKVYSGTTNINGSAEVKVLKTYKNSSLYKIKDLISNAGDGKTKFGYIIDRVIPYFIFFTIVIAIASFIYNFYLANISFDFALMAAVSVLIITCPCAFGIATPITYAVVNNILFNNKIIVSDSIILDNLDKIKTIVFDKTGTLTSANFKIIDSSTNINLDEFNKIIKTLAGKSEHPLSQAIYREINSDVISIDNFINYSGLGVSGVIANRQYFMGNLAFIKNNTKNINFKNKNHNSIVYLADSENILGWIDLADEINQDAKKLVKFLQDLGKKIIILSGDSQRSVEKVASNLAVEEYYFKQTPQNKLDFIKKLDNVLMIGDGINDAPALKEATFSIAISGIDVVSDISSAMVIKNNLKSIIAFFSIAKLGKKIIIQNISFALVYNMIFIPLAFAGKLNPLMAAIIMPISSLVVILNALRLKISKN